MQRIVAFLISLCLSAVVLGYFSVQPGMAKPMLQPFPVPCPGGNLVPSLVSPQPGCQYWDNQLAARCNECVHGGGWLFSLSGGGASLDCYEGFRVQIRITLCDGPNLPDDIDFEIEFEDGSSMVGLAPRTPGTRTYLATVDCPPGASAYPSGLRLYSGFEKVEMLVSCCGEEECAWPN